MITEYGYSAFACRPEVDIEGALLNAEIVGLALQRGVSRLFLYGLEPAELMDELKCNSWGNNALFVADDRWRVRAPMATYFGSRMINLDWVGPPGEPHRLFSLSITGGTLFGLDRASAFALQLPDGAWSMLVINKNPNDAYEVDVDFVGKDGRMPAVGQGGLTQFSRAQYRWQAAGAEGRPTVTRGPETSTAQGLPVEVPPYSLTVMRLAPVEAGSP